MRWDIELDIGAPDRDVFDLVTNWHNFTELKKLARVPEYHVISFDGRCEYFWLRVKDLPVKSSFCYGKRLMRRPGVAISIFTYKLFRDDTFTEPKNIEELILDDWDSFHYHTTRIAALGENQCLLQVAESDVVWMAGEEIEEIRTFYEEIRRMAESGIRGRRITPAEEPAAGDQARGGIHGADWINLGYESFLGSGEYNPYVILGVPGNSSLARIKHAYRTLAMTWHPDKMAGKGAAMIEYAHNLFIELTAAYHTILKMRGK